MAGSKIQAFWNHPAGPKTIHFWAPTFKWAISIANVADFSKPPEQLSYPHQSVVAISGLIWSRYSTQIIPTKQVKSNAALVKVFLEEMHGIRQCPYGHKEKEKYLVSNKDYDATQNGSGVPALHHVHGTVCCGASGHPSQKCGSDLIGATCKSEPSVAWIKSKPCIFTMDGQITAPSMCTAGTLDTSKIITSTSKILL